MVENGDFKLVKNKKLDKDTVLKITQNHASGRYFVEFSSKENHLTLQKSFQDSYYGKEEMETFINRIKTTEDLKQYFGVK